MNPEPVTPEKQLAICLYILAHGSSYSTVGDLFGVAESTAAVIFNDVCRVLVTTLYDRYVHLPKSADEWKQVVSIRSSRPSARGYQTSLRVKVIDQMPFISDG